MCPIPEIIVVQIVVDVRFISAVAFLGVFNLFAVSEFGIDVVFVEVLSPVALSSRLGL
jgi:hypothetical protein